MKKIVKVLLLLIISKSVFGQLKTNTYKANFSGADKRIVILSANQSLEIVGTSGSEVIIESLEDRKELPAEAEGLKIVSPGGGIDNTGVGANVVTEGTTMKIKIPKSKYYGSYIIKVPREINISVRENGNAYGKWLISGMKGEVEAETSYSTLNIKNVSGPIVARGGYGKMYVEYDQLNQSRPNSISASGAIDIILPADTKANLKVKATYADFFTDFDIQPIKTEEKTEEKGSVRATTANGQTIFIKDGVTYNRWGEKIATIDTKGEKGEKGDKGDKAEKLAQIEASSPTPQQSKTIRGTVSVEGFPAQKLMTYGDDEWSNKQNYNSDCNCNETNSTIGTINGGGVNLTIKSDHGNVYLRKKK